MKNQDLRVYDKLVELLFIGYIIFIIYILFGSLLLFIYYKKGKVKEKNYELICYGLWKI